MSEAAGTLTAAVDIGGTFTDCIIVADDGRVAYGKALSSPADDFQSGFFGSLEAAAGQLGHTGEDLFDSLLKLISHGSTVATNIVVEERGANVGLLTTLGHEDTLQMMRGVGRITGEPPENILKITETFKPTPLVPRRHVAGLVERVDSTGKVLVELDEAGLREAVSALAADGCDAFAVALLWSIQNPAHELRAREIINEIAPDAFVSVSHEISKSVGEYERTVATVINALVGPRTSQYLNTLDDRLEELGFEDGLMLMQSHGGMVPLQHGRRLPVLTIGSGPVGGLVGTQRLAADLGVPDVIATDMGGTSFDVGLLKDGEPLVALDTTLGKWNYRVPAVEVLSIGAGGGSIAWVDPQGTSLRVGPHSASSNPGPACYGRGGEEPTVTDANLVLGYVDPEVVFGTAADGRSIHPDRDLAEAAIARVADPLGLSVVDAALGIVEIANTKMANLLENVVIGRGFDPRDFLLVSYGGSGPLHAAGYARALGIDRIAIPGEVASVWSAFGIALSDVRYHAERDVALLSPFDPATMQVAYEELEAELLEDSAGERERAGGAVQIRRHARMRYEWQRNELEVELPLGDLDEAALTAATGDFESAYGERYGSAALLPGARLEITSLRAEVLIPVGASKAARQTGQGAAGAEKPTRLVAFERGADPSPTRVYDGNGLAADQVVPGPAVIDLPTTGIVVPAGAKVTRSPAGDFILTFEEGT
ncbi:MAG TPA: hydantoinase/oxoprolinase family protein [Solirubrobacterales bacterium]|nr:hydantoinase/oxoprolinase family protein [Solirubrobacterales bacterium]